MPQHLPQRLTVGEHLGPLAGLGQDLVRRGHRALQLPGHLADQSGHVHPYRLQLS